MNIYRQLLNENDLNFKSYNIFKNIEELNNKKKEDSYNYNNYNKQSLKVNNEKMTQLSNFKNNFVQNNNDSKKLEILIKDRENNCFKFITKKDVENNKKRSISQENIKYENRFDIFFNILYFIFILC